MPVFSKAATALSAVLALTSTVVYAAPLQPVPAIHDYKLSTHRRTVGPNNVEFVSYHPRSSYQTFHNGDHSLLSRSANATHPFVPRAATTPSGVSPDVENAAIEYCSEQTGIPKDSLCISKGFTIDIGITHVYLSLCFDGIPVTNGVANIAFDKTGKVVAFGSNIVNPTQISPSTPSLSQASAIKAAESSLGLTHLSTVPVTLSYVLQPDPTDPSRQSALLTHQFQLQSPDKSKWVQAHVDATNAKTPKVVHVVDFVAHAAYKALEWSQQDPTWSGFKMIENPDDKEASPNGWHQDSKGSYTYTRGNNVISYFGLSKNTVPLDEAGNLVASVTTSQETSDGLVFDYTWNPNTLPNDPTSENMDVARVNAFYVVNKIHDVMYKYGFNEKAFNFQDDNYGKGGVGGDAVEMQVQSYQDSVPINNANFATPPDGQPPHCNMYLWEDTKPAVKDGDLENDIITHELTHGLTNRMTGGGTGECLQTTESGGMGEGWSDTVAFWSEQNSTIPVDFVMGAWVTDDGAGIRSHPYSINKATNPYTYATVASQNEVHAIGEVWAMMLIEVYWALVGKYGFTEKNTDPTRSEGNIVFLHLLVDALPIQPCNPTFVSARDAIIQADQNRYVGANKCTLWTAFAKRGLGVKAKSGVYVDDMTVPSGCPQPQ
ncbi:hypothetical protein FRC04_005637 [Tulasnella sp. 424]|nr:hypothetical protein FRC04_005637 [Tulasnella sp. 424]KAG8962185.1 hypothetical protein FRC05_005485 [Tulasnella sp. 425]